MGLLRTALPATLGTLVLLSGSILTAQQENRNSTDGTADVTDLDLDDLLNIRVISPAKREQLVGRVPAAVHAVRADDVARSGATSLPEALRLVPGMEVARTSANTWAVTARGFNDNLSNKLLVMIDGRSVYSPLHSGVFWDVQDVCFLDLDRIEAVVGPGGSLWGSNAINGIVNVITKPAEETQGGALAVGAGTEDRVWSEARYGFELGEGVHARVYGKTLKRDDAANGLDTDEPAYDGWYMNRTGFRADWRQPGGRFTLMGDLYDGRIRQSVSAASITSPTGFDVLEGTTEVRGGNLLSRWERRFDDGSNVALQAYYDYTYRDQMLFRDVVHTLDLDFQHGFRPADGHEVNWGVGYRVYNVDCRNSFPFQITPEERTDALASAFLQDEITLAESLAVTLGCKVEHNDYSDFEFQPSVRLAWNADERQMLWGAVSRAVRTPSIVDVDARLTPIVAPGPVPLAFSIIGNDNFRSEELIAYEAGYRVRPVESIWADVALFYNDYDHLRSGTPGTPFIESSPTTYVVIPIDLGNNLNGQTWGGEVALNMQAAPWWLLRASYAHLQLELSEPSGEGRDPRHTALLRSTMQPTERVGLEATIRYVSELSAFDVDAYVEVGVRLAWRDPVHGFEAALVGQELLHEEHAEFQGAAQRSEIQRGVFLQVGWSF